MHSFTLDEVLVREMFDKYATTTTSSQCNPSTSFTFDFSFTSSHSSWYPNAQNIEPEVFLATIGSNLGNPNASSGTEWEIRIGKGGNIYSYRAHGIGQAVPPQGHPKGYFMDEVWQPV